jgi:hypothetical protein
MLTFCALSLIYHAEAEELMVYDLPNAGAQECQLVNS